MGSPIWKLTWCFYFWSIQYKHVLTRLETNMTITSAIWKLSYWTRRCYIATIRAFQIVLVICCVFVYGLYKPHIDAASLHLSEDPSKMIPKVSQSHYHKQHPLNPLPCLPKLPFLPAWPGPQKDYRYLGFLGFWFQPMDGPGPGKM